MLGEEPAARRLLCVIGHLLSGEGVAAKSKSDAEKRAAASEKLFEAAKKGDLAACRKALGAGADVNWQNEDFFEYTALHMAAGQGHTEVCQLLRKSGAGIDPRSESDETPLIMAARAGHFKASDFLLGEGADPQAKTNYKRNARTAQEYLDEMYKELGVPNRCGLGN
mmetsp:Transcript_90526/g.157000  ORF Transcript_90526/g.157000 Transcript_90526/m.157000 type:complete len:167 (-) Transcript_90526:103-603(-)